MRPDGAAAAERAEQAVGVRELVDQRLRLDDLRYGARGILQRAERLLVRPGVVADPVPLGMRALRERPALLVGELGAEHEEGGFYVGRREHVEYPRRRRRIGPVVERKRD